MPSASAEFLDTNILLYEWDSTDPAKQKTARKVVRRLAGNGVISSQVAQEFAWNARKKLILSADETNKILGSYKIFRLIAVDIDLITKATGTSDESLINLWDALIVEAAVAAGCKTLLTEDLNHGQVIKGVRIVNPFL